MTKQNEILKKIVGICSRIGQAESAFLTPELNHYVFTFQLLDEMSKEFGVNKEEIGEWFNLAQENGQERGNEPSNIRNH